MTATPRRRQRDSCVCGESFSRGADLSNHRLSCSYAKPELWTSEEARLKAAAQAARERRHAAPPAECMTVKAFADFGLLEAVNDGYLAARNLQLEPVIDPETGAWDPQLLRLALKKAPA